MDNDKANEVNGVLAGAGALWQKGGDHLEYLALGDRDMLMDNDIRKSLAMQMAEDSSVKTMEVRAQWQGTEPGLCVRTYEYGTRFMDIEYRNADHVYCWERIDPYIWGVRCAGGHTEGVTEERGVAYQQAEKEYDYHKGHRIARMLGLMACAQGHVGVLDHTKPNAIYRKVDELAVALETFALDSPDHTGYMLESSRPTENDYRQVVVSRYAENGWCWYRPDYGVIKRIGRYPAAISLWRELRLPRPPDEMDGKE